VAEGDGRVWQITALDETELGVERLAFGDAVALTGHLNVDVETDKAGRRPLPSKWKRGKFFSCAAGHSQKPQ